MYCDSGGLFYMCVVYLNYVYYVKTAEEMLSMRYFGTLYAVIYSLNCEMFHESVFRVVCNSKIGEAVVDSARHYYPVGGRLNVNGQRHP